jgi:hypothetical protein
VRVVGLYIARRVFPPMEENFVVIGEDV